MILLSGSLIRFDTDKPDKIWLNSLGLNVFSDSISVYIMPSSREREKGKRNERREH